MFQRSATAFFVLPSILCPYKRLYSYAHGQACHPKQPAAGGACGEDAMLITTLPNNRLLMAVMDGVGGWRKSGVDPSLFSNGLVRCMLTECKAVDSGAPPAPLDILKRAFWRLVDENSSSKARTPGSSTACVAIVNDKCVQIANVGDSGLLLMRRGEIILRTVSQQTSFNAPLQLTISPDGHVLDPTKQAQVAVENTEPGDVIVMGTDGLFDNLFDHEIVRIVQCEVTDGRSPSRIAQALVDAAYSNSRREDISTPFSVESQRANRYRIGGKPDDITVLICII